MDISRHDCALIKLYTQIQAEEWVWSTGHSLLTPEANNCCGMVQILQNSHLSNLGLILSQLSNNLVNLA